MCTTFAKLFRPCEIKKFWKIVLFVERCDQQKRLHLITIYQQFRIRYKFSAAETFISLSDVVT